MYRHGSGTGNRGKQFLTRILRAHLAGQSAEDFAEQELRNMRCPWCAKGLPLHNSQHNFGGLKLPCEAESTAAAPDRITITDRASTCSST